MNFDYKDWVVNRAEDLAQEQYSKDYYDLPNHKQIELWTQAEADYVDHYADQIDAAYEQAVEAKLLGGLNDTN